MEKARWKRTPTGMMLFVGTGPAACVFRDNRHDWEWRAFCGYRLLQGYAATRDEAMDAAESALREGLRPIYEQIERPEEEE